MTKISGEKTVDEACLIFPDDHPVCDKRSYIEYKWGVAFNPEEIKRIIESPTSKREAPASSTLLKRIRDGAEVSELLSHRLHVELWKQGILPP